MQDDVQDGGTHLPPKGTLIQNAEIASASKGERASCRNFRTWNVVIYIYIYIFFKKNRSDTHCILLSIYLAESTLRFGKLSNGVADIKVMDPQMQKYTLRRLFSSYLAQIQKKKGEDKKRRGGREPDNNHRVPQAKVKKHLHTPHFAADWQTSARASCHPL